MKTAHPSQAPEAHSSAPPRLRCEGVWKVYGHQAEERLQGLATKETEPSLIAAKLRAAGNVVAVGGVTFEIAVGEIFVLMGLSGSGKSTVLRCLSRLVEPTRGGVLLDGRDLLRMSASDLIDVRRNKMGMVFQHFGLMPHLSVLENVRLPLKLRGMEAENSYARAREMIDIVGLKGRESSFPSQMSGGQQQRVGIARSLAGNPELWLLDEPFSALDPLIRRQMQDEFLALQRDLNKTIVFVTHDFLEAVKLADRVAIMRDGMIVQVGTPAELLLRPVDDYVAKFSTDVPLTKALRASDIAERGHSESAAGPVVAAGTLLEDVVPLFEQGARSVTVQSSDGSTVGSISLGSILRTMGPRQ